jgi:hypothetical protein
MEETMKKLVALGALAAMVVFTWAACDSGSGGGGGGGGNAAGDDVTKTVTAADGGTVATPSGDAKLDIPAGALPADTEITVKGLDTAGMPDESDLGSAAYEFGPDGLKFNAPVTLTLKLDGEVPAETKAVLAVLEGGKWAQIDGSTVAGGAVSAPVTHFSTYVIIFIDDKAVVTTLECEGYEFSPCGGDPTGNWTVKDVCMDGEIGGNPFGETPECADQVYQFNMEFGGYINLKADKTYEVLMTPSATVHIELDDECLIALTGGQGTPDAFCTAFAQQMPGCAYAEGKCTCDGPVDIGEDEGEVPTPETGEWDTEGTTFYTTETGSTDEPKAIPYCVSGDEMAAQNTEVDEEDPTKSMTMTILLQK